jgi:ribonuclease R
LITAANNAVLFADVTVCIDKVDIAKAKIYAHVVESSDVQS